MTDWQARTCIIATDWWPPVGSHWAADEASPGLKFGRVHSLRQGKRQEVVISFEPKMCANRAIPVADFRAHWTRVPAPAGYHEP